MVFNVFHAERSKSCSSLSFLVFVPVTGRNYLNLANVRVDPAQVIRGEKYALLFMYKKFMLSINLLNIHGNSSRRMTYFD